MTTRIFIGVLIFMFVTVLFLVVVLNEQDRMDEFEDAQAGRSIENGAELFQGNCDRCHGVNGNSTDPRLPALAAQRVDSLEKVLHAYREGVRKSPQMAAMSSALTEQDVENLAAYYASQKARAVIFLELPPR